MPLQVDYLPIATAAGANVDSQVNFVGSGYQTEGFQAGLAQSKQLNKAWRQSSMMAAALANFIANTLGINVLDDGDISALIANLTKSIRGAVLANATPVTVNANTTALQPLMTVVLPSGVLNVLGKAIRFRASGFQAGFVGGGVVVTLAPTVNGVFFTNPTTYNPTTQFSWVLEGFFVVNAVGAAGSLLCDARLSEQSGGTGTGPLTIVSNQIGVLTGIDLTSSVTLGFGVSFSIASTSNNITENYGVIELVS